MIAMTNCEKRCSPAGSHHGNSLDRVASRNGPLEQARSMNCRASNGGFSRALLVTEPPLELRACFAVSAPRSSRFSLSPPPPSRSPRPRSARSTSSSPKRSPTPASLRRDRHRPRRPARARQGLWQGQRGPAGEPRPALPDRVQLQAVHGDGAAAARGRGQAQPRRPCLEIYPGHHAAATGSPSASCSRTPRACRTSGRRIIPSPTWTQPTTPQHIVDKWAKKPLDFEPGTRWQYSNTGYVVAGMIAEKVSGEPLLTYLHRKIFDPLGMTSVPTRTTPTPRPSRRATSAMRSGRCASRSRRRAAGSMPRASCR